MYLMCGSYSATAAALKIPQMTIMHWKNSAWWKNLEAEQKLQDDIVLSARLKRIAERSFDVVEDRLEHGNFVFDQKTGEIRRLPVSIRDAQQVASAATTHREMMESRKTQQSNDGQILDKLEHLAERFAQMAMAKTKSIRDENRTIDMADVVEEEDDVEEGVFSDMESEQSGEDECLSQEIPGS